MTTEPVLERLRRLFARRTLTTETCEGMRSTCWCWPTKERDKHGYGTLAYRVAGTFRRIQAHRLSYLLHRGSIADGLVVRHDCDNPCCVNPSHLRLGTRKDNEQDKVKRGRVRGERNPSARLTEEEVRDLIERHGQGESVASLAMATGLSHQAVRLIVGGKRWGHVE